MELLENFWVVLGLKLAVIALIVPVSALVIGIVELKVSARMQSRVGPWFVGGRGWVQLVADGIKFFQKEDVIPDNADRPLFKWAPAVVMISAVSVFLVIPFGPGDSLVVRNLDLGIYFVLAISSLATIGVLIGGWASANKYSLMGGLRAAGQMIAYELPLVLSVVGVVILAESMSLNRIVEVQLEWGMPFVVPQFLAFVIFMIAALAEMNRMPFDLPIAESELVMGFLTEYTGFRFLFFFLAEYASMFTLSAVAATLFLGGYAPAGSVLFGVDVPAALGPLFLVAKVALLVFVIIWVRWSWPRFRQDQLQNFAWKWLVPLALINIVFTAIFKVVF